MRFNDLVSLILESKKIITSPEQYGDPGMRHIVEVALRKYKGKVSRELLDWIKNNLVKVFPNWHYNFYKNQKDATIDEIFLGIVMMRFDEKEDPDARYIDDDASFNSVEDEILDEIITLNKLKEVKDAISKNDNSGWDL